MKLHNVLIVLLLFIVSASAHPVEKLSKNDFDMSSFLKNTRLQMIQKRSETKTTNSPHLRIRTPVSPQVTVKEGQTIVLECEASGNPPPAIHWLKNSKRIVQSNDQLYESLDQDSELGLSLTKGRLIINCADADDTATYTCVAENAFSRVVAQSKVTVLSSDKSLDVSYLSVPEQQSCIEKKSFGSSNAARITMWTSTRVEMIGSNVQLSCRTSGDNVQVEWIGPDEKKVDLMNFKFSLLNNGDLFIRKITWNEMGEYTCIARNSFSEDKIEAFLYPTLNDKKDQK